MKKIIYFILALITIIYLGFLCYANVIGFENLSKALYYIAVYGGVVIALLYAAVNFFGSPLKTVFFILLILMTVVLILTLVIPDTFRSLFKIVDNSKSFISILN